MPGGVEPEILVVCRSGARSAAAADFLCAQGFSSVTSMTGGMSDWVWETETCAEPPVFHRGDANADSVLDIADAVFVLGFLFGEAADPVCADAADANNDEALDIADAVAILGYLFGASGPLAEPFEQCGQDSSDSVDQLDCAYFEACP